MPSKSHLQWQQQIKHWDSLKPGFLFIYLLLLFAKHCVLKSFKAGWYGLYSQALTARLKLESASRQVTLPYPAPCAEGLDLTAWQAIIQWKLDGNSAVWKEHHMAKIHTYIFFFFFFYHERFLGREDRSNTNQNNFNFCILSLFLPLWNDPRLALALALGNVLLICISGCWEIWNKHSLLLANVKHHIADAWSSAQWGQCKTIVDPWQELSFNFHRTHCNGQSGLWLSI